MMNDYPFDLFQTIKNMSLKNLEYESKDTLLYLYNSNDETSILNDYEKEINEYIKKNKLNITSLKKNKILNTLNDSYYSTMSNGDNYELFIDLIYATKNIIKKSIDKSIDFHAIFKKFNKKIIKEYDENFIYENPIDNEYIAFNGFNKDILKKNNVDKENKKNIPIMFDILSQNQIINLSLPTIGVIYNNFTKKTEVNTYVEFISSLMEFDGENENDIQRKNPLLSIDIADNVADVLFEISNNNNEDLIKSMINNINVNINDLLVTSKKENNRTIKKLKRKYIIPFKLTESNNKKISITPLSKYDYEEYNENPKTLIAKNNALIKHVINDTFMLSKENCLKNMDKSHYKNIIASYLFYSIHLTYDYLKQYIDKIDEILKNVISLGEKRFGVLNIKDAFDYTTNLNISINNFKTIMLNNFYYVFLPTKINDGNYGMKINDNGSFVAESQFLNINENIYESYPFKKIENEPKLKFSNNIHDDLKDFILNLSNKTDIYNKKHILQMGAKYGNYSIMKKSLKTFDKYYEETENTNNFLVKIINILIDNTVVYNKFPYELIKDDFDMDRLPHQNRFNKNNKEDIENILIEEFENFLEKSTNNFIKVLELRKKIKNMNTHNDIESLRMTENKLLFISKLFSIKALSTIYMSKILIADTDFKNELLEKLYKIKKEYENIINKKKYM